MLTAVRSQEMRERERHTHTHRLFFDGRIDKKQWTEMDSEFTRTVLRVYWKSNDIHWTKNLCRAMEKIIFREPSISVHCFLSILPSKESLWVCVCLSLSLISWDRTAISIISRIQYQIVQLNEGIFFRWILQRIELDPNNSSCAKCEDCKVYPIEHD